MSRASIPQASVPSRLGRLTTAERRVWDAFPQGATVDLRTGDPGADAPAEAGHWPSARTVRGEVIAALLLGACPAAPGAVAAVRLVGARITGPLRIDHGQVSSLLLLRKCRFEGPIDLDGATTESIDLRGSWLTTLSAYGAQVRGTLDLRDTVVAGGGQAIHADGIRIDGSLLANRTVVTGSFDLINAQISGQVTLIEAELSNRTLGGHSLNAGGIRVGRSLLAQGLRSEGELRLPGAHIGSSLLLKGATLDGRGGSALHGDSLTVASEADLRPYLPSARKAGQERAGKQAAEQREAEQQAAEGQQAQQQQCFTAIGTVRLPGARFGKGLDLGGATLAPTPEQPALLADRMVVEGSLHLGDDFRTEGEIRLSGVRITGHLELVGMDCPKALLNLYAASAEGGVRDQLSSWPERLNLDGFTYGPFSAYIESEQRVLLLKRQARRSDDLIGGFRAQPYEQLASYYRSLGNDGEARTVLLAKQRALRGKLPWRRRIPGYVIDLLVGYGYRPLRAVGWAAGLLAASSLYFDQVRPEHVSAEDTSVFNPVLYAADHLIPVIHFGEPDVWQYHGLPEVVTAVLTVLGWTLGIAIAAAATRTFTRN
ncbi:hypothetical protein P3T36_006295 [Kitasatospora sp. MAP12-15]|uniref:pentapeptide repeat-containing protein n=1 Tax=unclassified Kitasatospora TaxID=2633591 RepID=UPI0024741062|nr:pentapeptide repeat-containing protein [Kitasatospora sp. MAP12-44]MDH6108912.1 hypothetical protein [Kitasatospora sp. MAP12-44]